jgi:type IV secretory pathway VirB10-like protein
MSQNDTTGVPAPDVAPKVAPESVALRAPPRPVMRLNRRTLAVLAGGLAVAVMAATMWSLQPKPRRSNSETAELYNTDRVSRSERLDQLPGDYSKLLPALPPQVPELGPPLPGDLGPAIVKSQQPAVASYSAPGQDPAAAERDALSKEAEAAAASSVFFRSSNQHSAAAPAQLAATSSASGLGRLRPAGRWAVLQRGPARRPERRAEPARSEGGLPEIRRDGNPKCREATDAGLAVSADGRNGHCRRVGDGHQI